MNIREKCCCFTGHRIIRPEHKEILAKNLLSIIDNMAKIGVYDFITGGAWGFDMLAAKAVLILRKETPSIRLILALPCKNQTKGWKSAQVSEYEKILAAADEVIYVSENYDSGCLHRRNRFMVDNSAHCVFYLTSERSGTAYTLKYALENGLEVYNTLQ